MQRAELVELLTRLQAGLGEMQSTEAKRARREMPSDLGETLSAFSNSPDGGAVLLGIDETSGFEVTGVDRLEHVSDRVGQLCRDEMEPPLVPLLSTEDVDGKHVLIVEVPELPQTQKPCYIRSRGLSHGAFIRVGGSNRKLTSYESSVLLANRLQPRDDHVPVESATVADLDAERVRALITRIQARRGASFRGIDNDAVLQRLGVLTKELRPTLAGLLALGVYPQQFFPQLDITFAFYARSDREPLPDGTRFLDSASIDGSMPTMIDEALQRIRLNMRHRAVIHGGGRTDVPDYPEAALREALANALMHRDYSGAAQGTQIRVEMFPDRIEIESPGGLYGPVSTETLQAGDPVSSSRNSTLAKLLEDVEGHDGQAIAENRGSGVVAMQRALRDAHLAPPEFDDQISRFIVRFSNATLVDDSTREWIESLNQQNLNDRQSAALALARRGVGLTNARYRAIGGCDPSVATRELGDLRDRGLLVKRGSDRHRVVWELARELRGLDRTEEASLPGRLTAEIRRNQVRRLLELGDRSSRELAEATGLSKQSVHNYLNALRKAGEVEPTSDNVKSPATRWRLVETAPQRDRLFEA